jgi:hypothetical protein
MSYLCVFRMPSSFVALGLREDPMILSATHKVDQYVRVQYLSVAVFRIAVPWSPVAFEDENVGHVGNL